MPSAKEADIVAQISQGLAVDSMWKLCYDWVVVGATRTLSHRQRGDYEESQA